MDSRRPVRRRQKPEHFSKLDPKLDVNLKLALRESLSTASGGAPSSGKDATAVAVGSTCSAAACGKLKSTHSRCLRPVLTDGSAASKRAFRSSSSHRSSPRAHQVSPEARPHERFQGIHRVDGRWTAYVRYRGQLRTLGSFDTSLEAACAHDEMVLRLASKSTHLGRTMNFELPAWPVASFGFGSLESQRLQAPLSTKRPARASTEDDSRAPKRTRVLPWSWVERMIEADSAEAPV